MTTTYSTLSLTVDNDGIALISIALPDRPMNVLTPTLRADLGAAIDRITSDESIKGAILTSSNPSAFIAGADIKELVLAFDKGMTPLKGIELVRELAGHLRRLETCGKPVACALNGLALGGGFEVALACHYRVLADDAHVGLPEVGLGLLPGAGGTQRLPRLIGIEKAAPILLSGRTVKAQEALSLGLVNAVVPASEVEANARAWLKNSPEAVQPWDVKGYRIRGGVGPLASHAPITFTVGTAHLAKSTQRNYPAPLAILSCIFEGTQVPIDVGLRIEAKYFANLLSGPVARNLMRTLFINKNAADKLVRRPEGVPKFKARKVGILGAGMMGSGIAYVSAAVGIDVVLLDSSIDAAEKGKSYSTRLLQKSLERGKTTQKKMDDLLAHIHPTTDYSDLADCDLVIEAVFENRAIKADVTRKADVVVSADAIFASNTSTLPITGLAEPFSRPADFIGLHFFSPVDKMPLVEVIMGKQTSPATLARALDYVAQIKKTPIVVNDSPGFFTSRVFGTFLQEGQLMLEEGIAPALIENAARQASFPVSPFAVTDEVSLELQLKVIEQNLADGQPASPQLPRILNILRTMVIDNKRVGKRGGAGFYDYPADPKGRKSLWPGLSRLYPPKAEQPSVDEVKSRLFYVQAIEAARCMELGVIDHPADADLGSILGIGFPTWTGGIISYIDTIGLPGFVAECERLAGAYGPRFTPSNWLKDKAARNESFHPPLSSVV